MNIKKETVKKTVVIVAGLSVSYAVGAALKNNVLPKTVIGKTSVWIAALVVGGFVAEATKDYVDKEFDDYLQIVSDANAKFNLV